MLVAVLVLLVLATFWPSLANDFLNYDDPHYITENQQVQAGLTFAGVRWAFANIEQTANWHPVTWLSHMADCELFGRSPRGHHFTNVLLHALNTALLFTLLNRMTGCRWRSFAVAALFSLHPLRVESVAWVSERKDVLSGFFFLLTLWAYVNYVRTKPHPEGRSSKLEVRFWSSRYYWLTLLWFALGLMSKPMLVTLPFVLLLLDWWPLERLRPGSAGLRPLLVEKLPLFLLTGVCIVTTLMAQAAGGAIKASVPVGTRLVTALVAYGRYLERHVWPAGLSVEYYYPQHWPVSAILLGVVVVAGVTTAALLLRRRRPYLAVGWFWSLGTLVPVIGLVQVGLQSMADRYTYIPSIGVLIAVIWGVSEVVLRQPERTEESLGIRYLAGGAVVVSSLACILLTRHQIGFWRNSGTLFRHALEVTERNATAYTLLGSYLRDQGQAQPAMEMYQQALRIDPRNEEAQLGTALLLMRSNRRGEAIGVLEQAVELLPNSGLVHGNLGLLLAGNGRLDEAEAHLTTALKLRPNYPGAHVVLGDICRQRHKDSQAIEHYQQALRLQPGYEPAEKRMKQLAPGP